MSRLPFVLWLQKGQFVWIPGWMAIYPSQEPNNIVVEGVHVSTCCRSPLLRISGMFANFETFQTMVNNTILFPSSVFTPKGKKNKTIAKDLQGFPGKIMLCSLLCNHNWNYFFFSVTKFMLWTPSAGMHLSQKNIKSSVLKGMSPFLGSAQVLNFRKKEISVFLILQLSRDLYPIAQKAFWDE